MDTRAIKLSEQKWDGSFTSPRWQIVYTKIEPVEKTKVRSQAIRQALFGNAPLIIELDSQLLALPMPDRAPAANAFRDGVKALGLEMRHRSNSLAQTSIFQIRLPSTKSEQHHVFVHVPAGQMDSEALARILCPWGLRYYVLPVDIDGNSFLDSMFQGRLDQDALLDACELIAFDCVSFAQMGIVSKRLETAEIKRRLSL